MVKNFALADGPGACYHFAMPIIYEFDNLPDAPTLNGSRGASTAGQHYRAKLTRDIKEVAFWQIMEQRQRAERPPAMLAEASFALTFYLPNNRRRGVENLIAAAKPYMDAICPLIVGGVVYDGDVVNDDWPAVKEIAAKCVYRKNQPGFRIEITPTEG